MLLGDLDRYIQKNETQPPTYAIHKNKLKMIKDLNIIYDTIEVLEKNICSKISDLSCSNIFTDKSQTRDVKERIKNGLYQIKKFLHC